MRLFSLFLGTFLASCTSSSPTGTPRDATPTDTTLQPDAPPFTPDSCKASLAAGNTAQLAVGQGQTFYTELTDHQVLTWEKGPQGGHHVWIALRLIGLRQQGTLTTIDLEDIQDPSKPVSINHSRVVYDFTRDEGGRCTLSGLRMQVDNAGSPPLPTLDNHAIRVTASLLDPDGAIATASKVIVITGVAD